jgi:hypothetical protein
MCTVLLPPGGNPIAVNKYIISYYMCHVCPSVSQSIWYNSASSIQIFTKFDIWVVLGKLFRKINCHQNQTRMTDTLHEDLCTFMIVSSSVLRRMRNILAKIDIRIKTQSFQLIFSENRVFYEIMWRNMVQPDRPQMALQYGACALHAA